MKKIFLLAVIVLSAVAVNARTWRINYDENAHADFRTLKQACESGEVQDGDIFYMEPGYHNGSQDDNTITRICTVYGPGWGFKNNAGNAIEVSTTYFLNDIIVDYDDVHISGLNIHEDKIQIRGGTPSEPRRNVVIERCRVGGISYVVGSASAYFYGIVLRNNYFMPANSWNIPVPLLIESCSSEYGVIEGNIILGRVVLGANNNGSRFDNNTVVCFSNIYGNVYCISHAEGAAIRNNIIISATSDNANVVNTFANGTVNNNNVYSITPEQATSSPDYSYHPTNQYVGATVENTFIGTVEGDFYDDGMRYQVKPGNVAKTASSEGGEVGAFGGEHPYVLCGRPAGIPYLYDVDVPEQPTNNTLSISFKVAGQNE